jgi:hypothetical protein
MEAQDSLRPIQLPLGGLVVAPQDKGESVLPTPTRSVDQRRGEKEADSSLVPRFEHRHHDVSRALVVPVEDEAGDPDLTAVGRLGHQRHMVVAVHIRELLKLCGRQPEPGCPVPKLARRGI